MRICSHAYLAETYTFQLFVVVCLFVCVCVFYIYSLLLTMLLVANIPCFHFLVCWCVYVFAAAILDLLHSGDDVRAGREVQGNPFDLTKVR